MQRLTSFLFASLVGILSITGSAAAAVAAQRELPAIGTSFEGLYTRADFIVYGKVGHTNREITRAVFHGEKSDVPVITVTFDFAQYLKRPKASTESNPSVVHLYAPLANAIDDGEIVLWFLESPSEDVPFSSIVDDYAGDFRISVEFGVETATNLVENANLWDTTLWSDVLKRDQVASHLSARHKFLVSIGDHALKAKHLPLEFLLACIRARATT
jgi:hypothetical protein